MLFLTFGNTHNTLRAEKSLKKQGISFSVMTKPAQIKGPCGLAICIDEQDEKLVMECLAKSRVKAKQKLFLSNPA